MGKIDATEIKDISHFVIQHFNSKLSANHITALM